MRVAAGFGLARILTGWRRRRAEGRFHRVIVLLANERVAGVEALGVEAAVALERHAEEGAVRLDVEFRELAAVPRVLAVPRQVIREVDVVASRGLAAPATHTQRRISQSRGLR